jgi:hypothetical protein
VKSFFVPKDNERKDFKSLTGNIIRLLVALTVPMLSMYCRECGGIDGRERKMGVYSWVGRRRWDGGAEKSKASAGWAQGN